MRRLIVNVMSNGKVLADVGRSGRNPSSVDALDEIVFGGLNKVRRVELPICSVSDFLIAHRESTDHPCQRRSR